MIASHVPATGAGPMTDPELVAKRFAIIKSASASSASWPARAPFPPTSGRRGSSSTRCMAGFRNILVHGYDTVDLAISTAP